MNRYKKMKTNDNKWKLKPKYEKGTYPETPLKMVLTVY
jgi:hypothetical protein